MVRGGVTPAAGVCASPGPGAFPVVRVHFRFVVVVVGVDGAWMVSERRVAGWRTAPTPARAISFAGSRSRRGKDWLLPGVWCAVVPDALVVGVVGAWRSRWMWSLSLEVVDSVVSRLRVLPGRDMGPPTPTLGRFRTCFRLVCLRTCCV